MTTLLVDLGGTRLKWAPASDPLQVEVLTHGGEWLSALRSVVSRADEVALCLPGLIAGGRVVSLPDKLHGIEGAEVAALVGARVPVLVNDAIAYGMGEARGLSGRTVVVTLGTGIGVAVVEDGAVLGRGPLGGGLLGGQLPLGDGSVESHCCAAALVSRVAAADSVEECFALLAAGDPAAARGFSEHRGWLARGLAALCLAHGPAQVVVGGGLAQPPLLDGLQEQVEAGLFPGQRVDVRRAAHGDAAALLGLQALLRAQVAA